MALAGLFLYVFDTPELPPPGAAPPAPTDVPEAPDATPELRLDAALAPTFLGATAALRY